jgi:uncharacterized protein YciI
MQPIAMLTLVLAGVLVANVAQAQSPVPVAAPDSLSNLYAVVITTGAAWDTTRQTHEQEYFKDHSANLRQLRSEGRLVLGARFSDKGFVVLRAASLDEAQALMDRDPSMQHRIFTREIHDFNVFYGGAVEPKKRPSATAKTSP